MPEQHQHWFNKRAVGSEVCAVFGKRRLYIRKLSYSTSSEEGSVQLLFMLWTV